MDQARDAPDRRGRLAASLVAAATAALYLAASRYVLVLNDPINLGAGFWPGAGITVTALLVSRRSWWPAILLAVGLAELGNDLTFGYGLVPSLWWTAGNVVEPFLAAWLVRRTRADSFASVRDVVLFLVLASVAAPVVGALLGATGTVVLGSQYTYIEVAVRWAIGDGLGIATLVPAGVLLLRDRAARQRLRNAEAIAVLAAVVIAGTVVFGFSGGDGAAPYLMVPFLLWAAIRFRVVGAAVAAFLFAQVVNTATGLGYGIFATGDAADAIMSLQAYVATMTATLLVVGARTSESADHASTAASQLRRADREDLLYRLAQTALDCEDHGQLDDRAAAILRPVLGQARTDALLRDDADRTAAVPPRQAQEGSSQLTAEARPGADEEVAGDVQSTLRRDVQTILRTARRRIDAEQLLVTTLAELDRSSHLVRQLLDSTGQGLYGLDLDGRCTFANRACADLLGIDDPQDLLGQNMHQLMHHSHADGTSYPAEECQIHMALQDPTGVHRDDEVLFRVDGSSFPAEYRSHPVIRDGQVIGAVVTFSDITAQREARLRLHESEARFRGLFEAANTGISMNTLDGRYVAVNPAFCRMMGYTAEELTALDFEAVTHPDDRAANRDLFDKLLSGEVTTYQMEKRYQHKDGSSVWTDLAVSLVRDEAGRPLHTVATIEDITTRKRAERRLRRSQALQRVAGELADVGGWAIDVATGEVSWSEEVHRILEYDAETAAPLAEGVDRYTSAYRPAIQAALTQCIDEGTPFDIEATMVTFAGRMIWVRVVAEAERDDAGTIVRVIGALHDITDLRRTAAETERLAQQLSTTLESITDAFFTVDRDWRFTYVNHRAEELLQRSRDELMGRNIWEAFPEAVGDVLDESYHRAMREGTTEVVEEYHFTPLDAWFTVRAYPSAQGLAVYFQDVTDRRRARLALREREARLSEQAALLDAARDAIVVRGLDHRIRCWNRSAEALYGWEADEVIGRSSRELFPDASVFDAATRMLLETGGWHGEMVLRHRSGTPLRVESRWTLVRDDAGEPQSILVIDTDVTDRRHLEAQLLRAQRTESIGTLAGGLAHDLNNALTPILMSTGMLRFDEEDSERIQLLDAIQSSTTRAADMVRQILSFARGVEGRRVEVDIDALLADVARIAEDTFLKTIAVVREEAVGLWPVVGDPTQLHQVLINLCVNARDAMPNGGTLRLSADSVVVDEQYGGLSQGVIPGPYVRILVEDDGEGMSPEVVDRIFEPFFTTKEQGKGTGLGLSISSGIVTSHGGFLRVYSEVGRGTRFLVHLPAAGELPQPRSGDDAAVPRGDGELILVIDDEDAIRLTLRRTLEAFAYRVLDAADGERGIALFTEHVDDVDAVISDMMMPGMDGPATIRALRDIRHDVPVIAASGLHVPDVPGEAADLGVNHFIAKPCSIPTLLQVLQDLLSRG